MGESLILYPLNMCWYILTQMLGLEEQCVCSRFIVMILSKHIYDSLATGCPKKNVLVECYWSQGAQAPLPVFGTTWAWKVFFGRFLLTKTRQDQAPPKKKKHRRIK